MYSGICTATEAAGLGTFGVICISLSFRRLTGQVFINVFPEVAEIVGKIFILIIGASIFSTFMAVTEVPFHLSEIIVKLNLAPILVLGIVLILYVLLGFFMPILSTILVTTPILHPVLVGMGFDPVWLAVITTVTVLMGHISPPVGIVVFALSGMVRDVPIFTIFRGVLPFLGAMLVCLIILIAFPQISLWLPGMMIPG